MLVSIQRPNRGTILHVKRIGVSCGLLIVESESLLCEVTLKPASLELEVRVAEKAVLASSGRFQIELPADCILRVRAKEYRVEIEAADGSRKFAVLDGMAWIEAI